MPGRAGLTCSAEPGHHSDKDPVNTSVIFFNIRESPAPRHCLHSETWPLLLGVHSNWWSTATPACSRVRTSVHPRTSSEHRADRARAWCSRAAVRYCAALCRVVCARLCLCLCLCMTQLSSGRAQPYTQLQYVPIRICIASASAS